MVYPEKEVSRLPNLIGVAQIVEGSYSLKSFDWPTARKMVCSGMALRGITTGSCTSESSNVITSHVKDRAPLPGVLQLVLTTS